MGEEKSWQQLFKELTNYERREVDLQMEGAAASPMQIVQAHSGMLENVVYMRDYVLDETGDLKQLCFDRVKL